MPTLAGAHKGYLHQDIVTALVLGSLLLPQTAIHRIQADRKRSPGDVFDDLTIEGQVCQRVQIKSHSSADRELTLADLATTAIDFPLDRAVQSFLADPEPADEYRLLVTYTEAADDLLPYLVPMPDINPLIAGMETNCYRLSLDEVWPPNGDGWRRLRALKRTDVGKFLSRFVIETGCPRSSHDLRSPGPIDTALLSFLSDRIGVGRPPNQGMDLANAAAHLILRAQMLRADQVDGSAQTVIAALRLKVDYDRVEEVLPLDPLRLVSRDEEVDAIKSAVEGGGALVVSGPPGAGKSWLLHLVRDSLAAEGWLVALHFCFVDLLDQARQQRTTITSMFGSLIAELLDAAPDLVKYQVARYAVGPSELEALLQGNLQDHPDRRIAIIVDGLDHADRVASPSVPGAAADIAAELAGLALPDKVALVIGSQPGDHLSPLGAHMPVHVVSSWKSAEVSVLAERLGIDALIKSPAIDLGVVIGAITERSRGNPLYATYLGRASMKALEADANLATEDLLDLVHQAPPFDAGLDDYYQWLIASIKSDEGAIYMVQLMATLDFALTSEDLAEIYPLLRPLISGVISRLAPVLADEPAMGGLRVYHESFQRFVRRHAEQAGTDLAAVVEPAIIWLENRGFERDKRAFRSLFGLMQVADRHADILNRVDNDFVSRSVVEGQPGDAVMANLRLAASSAATLGSWTDLARLVEIARSADYLHNWRFNDEAIAEEYGRGFAALRGASALADRLLHDGRCTFLPRPGLVLCQLCEELGVSAPWAEYLAAEQQLRRTDNTLYAGGEPAVHSARVAGEIEVAGRDKALEIVLGWLEGVVETPVHDLDIARSLAGVYGDEALQDLGSRLGGGPGYAWVTLARAELAQEDAAAALLAEEAVASGLPADGLRLASILGASVADALGPTQDLLSLTELVSTSNIHVHDDLMDRWLVALDLAAAASDDLSLTAAEALVPANSWYRRWLRFVVFLYRSDADSSLLLAELDGLSRDTRSYVDGPRLIDLFAIHRDIQQSFYSTLERFDNDDDWCVAAESLSRLCDETTGWLQGSRTGPLPVDELLKMLMVTSTTKRRAQFTAELGKAALHPDERSGEYYDTHAADQILLSRILLAAGDREDAEAAWQEAGRYLPAYGFRKDVTVFEVLENLDALAIACPEKLPLAIEQLHPIVEKVLVHTDGKETRWAVHHWMDAAGKWDPTSALAYLGLSGLSHSPSFGRLDHGMAHAVIGLADTVDAATALAGWIGIGSEAREHYGAAIKIGESEPVPGWDVVVGAVIGDGTGAPKASKTHISESAARVGKAVPAVAEVESDMATSGGSDVGDPGDAPKKEADEPTFEVGANDAGLEVARAVRHWRDAISRAPAQVVVRSVTGRIVAMFDDGQSSEAEALLGRLARDTPLWDRSALLQGLADALVEQGPPLLAAMACTYAYTRTSDGWHRFGGEKHQRHFTAALECDTEVALRTLMAEVADAVGTGGDMGVNRHLVELLAAAGLPNEAWGVWTEARRAIEYRLPSVGEVDVIEIKYSISTLGAEAALACALLARLNHVASHERRVALVGLERLLRRPGGSCADAVTMAEAHAPASVLTALLALMAEHEPSPFETSAACVEALRAVASGPLVVARTLARGLLERVGTEVPLATSAMAMVDSSMPEPRFQTLVGYFGRARVAPVEAEWDEFAEVATRRLEDALQSDRLRFGMKRFGNQLAGQREGRRPALWGPVDEEQETILQEVGSSARANLAASGEIDPGVEERVARALLPEIGVGLRLAGSRCPRPAYRARPRDAALEREEAQRGVTTAPVVIPEGEYQGWLVMGHHESELKVGEGFGNPVTSVAHVWSCLTFADAPIDLGGMLPVGHGNDELWTAAHSGAPIPITGPLSGCSVVWDGFGAVQLLSPHWLCVTANSLEPVASPLFLGLADAAGQVALRLRTWREAVLGDDRFDDWQHRVEGMELIVRPDILEAVAAYAGTQNLLSVHTWVETGPG